MQLFNLHLLPGSYICVFGKLSVNCFKVSSTLKHPPRVDRR